MALLRAMLCIVGVTLLAWVPAAVSAQGGQAPDETTSEEERDAQAREHFQAGHEFFANTEYEDALVEFQQAYELASEHAAPSMLFNVASTLERLGRFDESADALERYLEEAEEPETRARLRARIVSLRRRAVANRAPEVTAEGGADQGLVAGSAVALSLAGAGAVAFAVLGGLTIAENDAVEAGCFAARTCVAADVETLETLSLAADVSWVAAASAGVVGLSLLIVAMVSGGDDEAEASLSPAVALGPSEARVLLYGAF